MFIVLTVNESTQENTSVLLTDTAAAPPFV